MSPEQGFVKWSERRLARCYSVPVSKKLSTCPGLTRLSFLWKHVAIPGRLNRIEAEENVAAIFQTTCWNRLSWMRIYNFLLKKSLVYSLGAINNIPALVQMMAWRRLGDKPLSEPKIVISVTRPQWVNSLNPGTSPDRLLDRKLRAPGSRIDYFV